MDSSANRVSPDDLIDQLFGSIEVKARQLNISEQEIVQMGLFENEFTRERWAKLEPVLWKEYEERWNERTRNLIQSSVREKIILDWIKNNISLDEKRHEHTQVKATIEAYLRQDREEALRDYLTNVIALGIKRANRRRSWEQWGAGGYWGHGWTVVKGGVRLVLVLAILSSGQSRFETILFSLLILLYNSIDSSLTADRFYSSVRELSMQAQFRKLHRHLRIEELAWEREERVEEERKAEKFSARNMIRFWISEISMGVSWLIAMFSLVSAVVR